MSEAVSALGGASHDGLISIREPGPQGMITLRGDLASDRLSAAVQQATGLALPATRQAVTSGDFGVLWMSPDEVLVLCPYDQSTEITAKLTSHLADVHALAVDVSDARAVFVLSGADAHVREVLAKIAPVDLHPDSLAIGELRRTRMAQVAAAFWIKAPGEAQVVCFRSVAGYMFDLLSTSARTGSSPDLF